MTRFLTPSEIDSYIQTDSSFDDFTLFEDDPNIRLLAKEAFLTGAVNAPKYDYPKLDILGDSGTADEDKQPTDLRDKKHQTYEAILELEQNKDSGYLTPEIYELYAGYHEASLQKMMLVQAAEHLRHAGSSSAEETARTEFMQLNKELYGEMDSHAFNAIMTSEQNRVTRFKPTTELAWDIQSSLEDYFNRHEFNVHEEPLLDTETIEQLNEIILERYAHILNVVPGTEDIVYDAVECRDIMNEALERGGLSADGWTVEVSTTKANPTTNDNLKKIFLPVTTRRTAPELRRVIVHEQEVHARRAKNGADLGVKALESGTANYADVEEGLGVLLECVLSKNLNNPSFNRARDRYITAGLALGTDGTPKDSLATFNILWKLLAIRSATDGSISEGNVLAAKKQAFVHIENAFRGTNFAKPGVIYSKLKVYYEGLSKNAQFFMDQKGDLSGALDRAMRGKHDHTDPEEAALVQRIAKGA